MVARKKPIVKKGVTATKKTAPKEKVEAKIAEEEKAAIDEEKEETAETNESDAKKLSPPNADGGS